MKVPIREWEKQFDEKFPIVDVHRKFREDLPINVSAKWIPKGKQELKTFIRSLLALQRKSIIEEIDKLYEDNIGITGKEGYYMEWAEIKAKLL